MPQNSMARTEEQIELAVEKKIDALDAEFLKGNMRQEDYDFAMKNISEWAEVEYRFRKR